MKAGCMSTPPQHIDSRAICNAILQESWNRGFSVSHLKLQKLLFLCHAYYLVKARAGNLVRGSFEAWQYGPVHREAYEAFKQNGEKVITTLAESCNPITGEKTMIPLSENQVIKDVVADVVRFYGGQSPGELVELTHAKDGPWDYIVKSAPTQANLGLRIPNEVIIERFKYLWFGTKHKLQGEVPNDEKQITSQH